MDLGFWIADCEIKEGATEVSVVMFGGIRNENGMGEWEIGDREATFGLGVYAPASCS